MLLTLENNSWSCSWNGLGHNSQDKSSKTSRGYKLGLKSSISVKIFKKIYFVTQSLNYIFFSSCIHSISLCLTWTTSSACNKHTPLTVQAWCQQLLRFLNVWQILYFETVEGIQLSDKLIHQQNSHAKVRHDILLLHTKIIWNKDIF